jgi:hypothetical protein
LNRPNHNRGVKINLTQELKKTEVKLKKPKQNRQHDELTKFEEELKTKTLFDLRIMNESRKKIVSKEELKSRDVISSYKTMLLLQEFHRRLRMPLDPFAKSSIEMFSKMCRKYMG